MAKLCINQKKIPILPACTVAILSLGLWLFPNQSGKADDNVTFNPPRGGAPKDDTRGGASRGDFSCAKNPTDQIQQLMILAPSDSTAGITLSKYPKLFVYIPATSARQSLFTVKDETGQLYYQSTVPLSGNEGVMSFALPPAYPLIIGKRYQWGIAILCSNQLKADSPFVNTWIQRTDESITFSQKLQQASGLELAALYGANGIWYDMLTTLAKLKQEQPEDKSLDDNWVKVLESVGLGKIASKPLVSNQ